MPITCGRAGSSDCSSPAMVVWPAGTLLSATGITVTIAVPSRW